MSRRALSMLAEQTLGRWAAGVGAIVLAVSGVFGGWEKAEGPPPTGPGVAIDGGTWTVTLHDARLVGELGPMKLPRKENHWLAVVATIEVKTDETRPISGVIQLPETAGIDNDEDGLTSARDVMLMRDATIISQLHPGMPEKVVFFWEREKNSPVPSELRLVVTAWEYRENSLTQGNEWFPNEDAYTVASVPVLDKRDATASASPTTGPRPTPSTTPTARPSGSTSPRPTASARPSS
ncbi:hypothetical protein [Allorhizocola rhizosphaerae]|uniref:hypothetical protein n=1 Tax=Allorhizocola rhizosphaerae TaxID=1872709 RepID=UPI0013C3326F|nr:hypothetical protein [Allorhizocola rhizosphaerae]